MSDRNDLRPGEGEGAQAPRATAFRGRDTEAPRIPLRAHPDTLDRRIDAALSRRPRPEIPAGFAARVAAGLPALEQARPVQPAPRGRVYSRIATLMSLAILLTAVALSAPYLPAGSRFAMGVQWLICGEIVVLALALVRDLWLPNLLDSRLGFHPAPDVFRRSS